jgi:hypothetical protein
MIHITDTTDIFNMTISFMHLAMYKKDKDGIIVIVAAQKVERTGRREGTVLRSLCTQKCFAYTKEVDHLGNAKERSYYNHTASCTSEEYCRSLILEQGAATKSRMYIKVQRRALRSS